jgi:hypothetical protein
MHNIHPYGTAAEQYLGIIRTNALPFETARSEGGIFLEACRINQAWDNNAQKNWNENIKRHSPCFERHSERQRDHDTTPRTRQELGSPTGGSPGKLRLYMFVPSLLLATRPEARRWCSLRASTCWQMDVRSRSLTGLL